MGSIRGGDECEEKSQGYVLRQAGGHLEWLTVVCGRWGPGERTGGRVGAQCYNARRLYGNSQFMLVNATRERFLTAKAAYIWQSNRTTSKP